jgi:hypothetical protein
MASATHTVIVNSTRALPEVVPEIIAARSTGGSVTKAAGAATPTACEATSIEPKSPAGLAGAGWENGTLFGPGSKLWLSISWARAAPANNKAAPIVTITACMRKVFLIFIFVTPITTRIHFGHRK